jgi:hypothetical protein
MKRFLAPLIVTVALSLSLFSLTGCQQCLRTHDVPYTYYTNHCVSHHNDGSCAVSVPLLNHGYESHCDEWAKDQ